MTKSFGRNRPDPAAPRLYLGDYMLSSKLVAPAALDYTPAASAGLANILGNDTLGDCVIAGALHVSDIWRANAKTAPPFATADMAIKLYSAVTGYVPGNPNTDRGTDEVTALEYFRTHGTYPDGSGRVVAWLSVDGNNIKECKQALYLFENLFFGIELPDAWITPFPSASGFVWDVAGAPNPNNGHCVIGGGYDSLGVKIDSWGMLGHITWPAVAQYATTKGSGELYSLLCWDSIGTHSVVSPDGLNWDQLKADMKALGGNL